MLGVSCKATGGGYDLKLGPTPFPYLCLRNGQVAESCGLELYDRAKRLTGAYQPATATGRVRLLL